MDPTPTAAASDFRTAQHSQAARTDGAPAERGGFPKQSPPLALCVLRSRVGGYALDVFGRRGAAAALLVGLASLGFSTRGEGAPDMTTATLPLATSATVTTAQATLTLYRRPQHKRGREHESRRGRLTAEITLREFFDLWFRPIVLDGDTNAKPATVREYESSLAWFETLTTNPPVGKIDAFTLADFKTGLRSATWRRGPNSPERPLRPHTVAKHLKQVRAVLQRVGPPVDRATECAGLVDVVPYLKVATPRRLTPGYAFPLAEAQAIAAAAARLTHPIERARWVARLSLLFYTGLRVGTVQALRPDHVTTRDGRRWLVVDGDHVKTKNAVAVPVHDELAAALDRLTATPGALAPCRGGFFPATHKRTIARQHDQIQRDAGLAKPRGFHAWRRCHAEQMVALGAASGELAAQLALDHADRETTRQFYANARALLIDKLPKLIADADDAGQLRLF